MKWSWEGGLRIEMVDPGMFQTLEMRPGPAEWPRVAEVQVDDGRAYVLTEAFHTRFFWFVMDLAGLETPGAPKGENWVQVSLGGNVSPRTRNTEHIAKDIEWLAPSYVDQKFPGYGDFDYEAMGFFFLPFLVRIFEMEPLEGAKVG